MGHSWVRCMTGAGCHTAGCRDSRTANAVVDTLWRSRSSWPSSSCTTPTMSYRDAGAAVSISHSYHIASIYIDTHTHIDLTLARSLAHNAINIHLCAQSHASANSMNETKTTQQQIHVLKPVVQHTQQPTCRVCRERSQPRRSRQHIESSSSSSPRRRGRRAVPSSSASSSCSAASSSSPVPSTKPRNSAASRLARSRRSLASRMKRPGSGTSTELVGCMRSDLARRAAGQQATATSRRSRACVIVVVVSLPTQPPTSRARTSPQRHPPTRDALATASTCQWHTSVCDLAASDEAFAGVGGAVAAADRPRDRTPHRSRGRPPTRGPRAHCLRGTSQPHIGDARWRSCESAGRVCSPTRARARHGLELCVACRADGARLVPQQQVLGGLSGQALLRRQRVH